VTADTALRLGHWFRTSPEFWLNLQSLYELRLARQEVSDSVKKLPTLMDHRIQAGERVARHRRRPPIGR
jgi:antitoxin HigA-1